MAKKTARTGTRRSATRGGGGSASPKRSSVRKPASTRGKKARSGGAKARRGRSGAPPARPAQGARSSAPARLTNSADPAGTRIVSRSTIFAGNKYVYDDVVIRGDDGRQFHRQMVRHPGAVTVLPLLDTPEGVRVVIIRNERFAVEATLVELPAGTLEPNEDPSVSAVRELEEEIGYTAEEVRLLGKFFTTPGVTNEIMYTYAATRLRHVGQRLEADEKITVETITPDEAFAMIDDGRMMDAKSMLALLQARRQGLI